MSSRVTVFLNNINEVKETINNIKTEYMQGNYFNLITQGMQCINNIYKCASSLNETIEGPSPSVEDEVEELYMSNIAKISVFLTVSIYIYLIEKPDCAKIVNWKDSELTVEDSCSICLNNYILGQDVYHTLCNHYFCVNCLKKWLECKSNCPICRKEIQI